MSSRKSERLKQQEKDEIHRNKALHMNHVKQTKKQNRTKMGEHRKKSKVENQSSETQISVQISPVSPITLIKDLVNKPSKVMMDHDLQSAPFDGNDLRQYNIDQSDIRDMKFTTLRLSWSSFDNDGDEKILGCGAVLPVPHHIADVLDRHLIERKHLLSKVMMLCWRKSARMTGKYGEYECLNGAFLRGLEETIILDILALIYNLAKITLKRWRDMIGVVRLLPRTLAEFQSQKRAGEKCEFRGFERYFLMQVMLQQKVSDRSCMKNCICE